MNPLSKLVSPRGPSTLLWQLAAGLAVVIGIWAISRWASTPAYVSLYRDLEFGEAGQITDNLSKTDIPFRLTGGGSEVLVPATDVARARVALAKAGLPANGRPGLELFDKPAWGMTDFTEHVTYQRALEGELARTIGGLQGVARAQVHLVIPEAGPLHRATRSAGAAVVLTLKPGATLLPETVRGITYIVSNSVEQLTSENVAVMDDAGHVLSVPAAGEEGEGLTTRQLEIARSVESHLEEKIEGMLATVVGVGRSRAQVTAAMSFDQVDRTTESYDPDGAVLATEQHSEGPPAPSELGGAAGSQTVVSNSYQNSRKLEKFVGSVGAISKLSVAVLVDEKALKAAAPGGRGLSVAQVEAVVRTAIGADSARGDRVNVSAVPFDAAFAAALSGAVGATPAAKGDPVRVVERFSRPIVSLVALVVLALIAFRVMSGGLASAPAGAPAPAVVSDPNARPLIGRPELGLIPGRGDGAPDGADAAAQVMKSWIAESRS